MSSWGLSAAVLVFLTWFNAPPHSLGEAARREALRRQILPPSTHVLTTENLPPPRPGDFIEPPAPPAGAAAPADANAQKPAEPAKPADQHDEKWWHDRITAARDTVTHDQMAVEALQSEVNALTRDFVNRDDPAQKAQIEQQRVRTLNELDRMKKQLVDDQKAVDDIAAEARRDGVPPGWIRGGLS